MMNHTWENILITAILISCIVFVGCAGLTSFLDTTKARVSSAEEAVSNVTPQEVDAAVDIVKAGVNQGREAVAGILGNIRSIIEWIGSGLKIGTGVLSIVKGV